MAALGHDPLARVAGALIGGALDQTTADELNVTLSAPRA
jgi:hypothetical protein